MKKTLLFLLAFGLAQIVPAQVWIDVDSDYIEVNSSFAYSADQDFVFKGIAQTYDPVLFTRGLHFTNGQTTTMSNRIVLEDEQNSPDWNSTWFASPIIGVHGANTKLFYRGSEFRGDNTATKTSIVVSDSGHFVVGAEAHIDLVFPRYGDFTRQFWVYGDGTGIFELEEGFVADHSEGGAQSDAFGSVRLSNTIFITHSSESLPYYYRRNPTAATSEINAHLVFENQPGSRWIVRTQPQNYPGGLWLYESMEVCTETDLEISGNITVFYDGYVNRGGVVFRNPNRTLRKTGAGRLIISGDQLYDTGSRIEILEGCLDFQTDPYNGSNDYYAWVSDQNNDRYLSVVVQQATLRASAGLVRLKNLSMLSPQDSLKIGYQNKIQADTAVFAGNLYVEMPDHAELSPGDTLHLFQFMKSEGQFDQISSSNQDIAWDTTSLYTEGKLVVANPNTGFSPPSETEINIFPQPAGQKVFFEAKNTSQTPLFLLVFSPQGKLLAEKTITSETPKIELTFDAAGTYFYRLLGANQLPLKTGQFLIGL